MQHNTHKFHKRNHNLTLIQDPEKKRRRRRRNLKTTTGKNKQNTNNILRNFFEKKKRFLLISVDKQECEIRSRAIQNNAA
jgi:hypothetical protein